jgi:membrane protease YdiL (CAAX protease family)
MNPGIFYNASNLTKLLFSVFIVLVSFLFISIVGTLLIIPLFNIDIFQISEVLTNFEDARNIRILKYFQILQSFGIFIIPSFILAFLFGFNILQYLHLNQKPIAISILNIILITIIALPLINYIAYWNSQMSLPDSFASVENWMKEKEETVKSITEAFLGVNSIHGYLINLFVIAILAGVGEELLFRGIFQRLFIEWTGNHHIGIIITSILFSAVHLQFYGFIPRLMMGVFLGYLFFWSRTLWLPIIAHIVNNGIAVSAYYFYGKDFVEKDIDTIGIEQGGFSIVILSSVLVGLLILIIYRVEKSYQIKSG